MVSKHSKPWIYSAAVGSYGLVMPVIPGKSPCLRCMLGSLPAPVSSVAAFQPVAYMGAYSASKSYVLHFTESLWAEAREKGVTVLALCPGTTRTDFFDISGAAPGWLEKNSSQDVATVVRTAIKALEKKRSYIVSGWKNYILSLLVRLAMRSTVVQESMKYFRPEK